jgi:uncharacterized protein (TIGR02246 family)
MITLARKAQLLCWCLLLVTNLSFGSAAGNDDRHQLSSAVNSLAAAWNNKNADAIVRLFTSDAILVMPTGNETRTRSAIRDRLLKEWSGKLKESKLSHEIESVAIESKTTAVVTGKYRLRGAKLLGVEKSPEGKFIFRNQKENGRWMIQRAELQRSTEEN